MVCWQLSKRKPELMCWSTLATTHNSFSRIMDDLLRTIGEHQQKDIFLQPMQVYLERLSDSHDGFATMPTGVISKVSTVSLKCTILNYSVCAAAVTCQLGVRKKKRKTSQNT